MAYLKIVILQIESIVPRYKFGVSWNPSGSLEDEQAQWIFLGLKLIKNCETIQNASEFEVTH